MEKTAVIEGRLDMRDLAACAEFFINEGTPATSKSDLMYRIVATFAQSAVQHHNARKFESTEEAMNFLEDAGLGSMNRIKKGDKRANAFTLAKVIREEKKADTSVDYFKDLLQTGKVRVP